MKVYWESVSMHNDVGVLLVFFNKVDTLKKVFEAVKRAQPSKIFLAQDGVRENVPEDLKNIKKCREIVEDINWECEIYKNYSDKNLSCDPRVFTAISWAFQYINKLIIIEDDSVPNQSFFTFMGEMLERYEYDDRIQMISGIERLGINRFCKDSYYFSTINAGCAWATWKRVWNDIEKWSDCTFLENDDERKSIDHYVKNCMPSCFHDFVKRGEDNIILNKKIGGIYSWEYAVANSMILANRLAITPKVNLIKNIGVVKEATHSGNSLETMPYRIRRLFFMETYELEFPLKHPDFIMRDSRYEKLYEKEFSFNKWNQFCIKMEHIYLLLRYLKFDEIIKIIKRKFKRKKSYG